MLLGQVSGNDALTFRFGFLIVVARCHRGVLVGGRILDAAVDAHRTAMHEAIYAGVHGSVQKILRPRDVRLPERLPPYPLLPKERGQVKDDVHTPDGGPERLLVSEIPPYQRGAFVGQLPCGVRAGIANEGLDGYVLIQQAPRQLPSGEAGSPRHEYR